MRPRSRPARLAALIMAACALALAATGCGGTDDKDGNNVQAATEADITRQVNELADQIVVVIGEAKISNPTSNAAPCENDIGDDSGTVNYVLGTYQIRLPNDRHQAAFTQVRDHWRGLNWTITADRFNQETREGSVSAKEPTSGSTFTLTSSASPEWLTLLITSACYRDSAAG
ncbi:hypothetical protein ACIBSW_24695 [Actinoplanes sp. NPDC049668]|uniref:hypothetical protein n=1 Tax=unclassified Actinoplanes TaxID=2626549 RepID=UPI0033B90321